MSATRWLDADARSRITKVVRDVESRTAAEIVVTLKPRSDTYRHADFATGALTALVALLVYVYAPITFHDGLAPPAIVCAFAGGALLSDAVSAVKRVFVRRAALARAVATNARAAFFDQRVGSTSQRTGILVYVSLFERKACVLADTGVDIDAMEPAWSARVGELEASLRASDPVSAFVASLASLGALLAEKLPVRAGDVNELPDEVAS
jgi:putative membrane protein